ncbi:DUF554 domain-containing protein [Paenibacillus filicis]|uniref:DUF554 domain-containing protein n=1 Tax=Paenibacillus gyeongsangnamensis TaxID=3388067 RepID=A0ABT4QB82_9BACL|nr:DUF554 domain-containing protein [Paenibacillus filicis]MCZ8514085.1 DUF554 domain-containing protein [Paenibacillus filicis]
MALWGTIVNAAAIVAGTLLGLTLNRMKDSIRQTVMQGIGLGLLALGISMTLKSSNFLLIVSSLVLGGVLGEWMKVDRGLERLGELLEQGVDRFTAALRKGRAGADEPAVGRSIGAGFVNATLIYCVGAMAILGPLDGGLRGDHQVLYTKSLLDGFLSIILGSTMGVGVMFSSVPVFLYQGAIALAASLIASVMDQTLLGEVIAQITAVGGVLIMGVGVNLLELRRINVANLLPSIAVAAAAVPLIHWVSAWWALP